MGLIQGILAGLFPPQPEPMADVRPGTVATVSGLVVARDLLTCPLTGEHCVYYHYTVEEWRPSRVVGIWSDGFWQLTDRDEAIMEFYLQDDEERAIVSPQAALVDRDRRVYLPTLEWGITRRRAQRLIIRPGDRIEVTGMAERVTDVFDENRTYRTLPTRILLRAPHGGHLIIRPETGSAR